MKPNILLDKRMASVKFRVDNIMHIKVDADKCASCSTKLCLICPAGCYQYDETLKKVSTNFEGCLECGTCRNICPYNAIDWSYPRGGYGVVYKLG